MAVDRRCTTVSPGAGHTCAALAPSVKPQVAKLRSPPRDERASADTCHGAATAVHLQPARNGGVLATIAHAKVPDRVAPMRIRTLGSRAGRAQPSPPPPNA